MPLGDFCDLVADVGHNGVGRGGSRRGVFVMDLAELVLWCQGLRVAWCVVEADCVEEVCIVVGCPWDFVGTASLRILVGAECFRVG